MQKDDIFFQKSFKEILRRKYLMEENLFVLSSNTTTTVFQYV